MKLRNKKTGEIESWDIGRYNSLKELCEEWEDYEKPKGYWFIAIDGTVLFHELELDNARNNIIKDELVIHFEDPSECQDFYDKLLAWKRLKDKGFRFNSWYGSSKDISFSIPQEIIDKTTAKDLDLLFGGEV